MTVPTNLKKNQISSIEIFLVSFLAVISLRINFAATFLLLLSNRNLKIYCGFPHKYFTVTVTLLNTFLNNTKCFGLL